MRTGRGAGAPTNVGDGGYPYRGDETTVAIVDTDQVEAPPPPPSPAPPPEDRDLWPWLLVLLALVVAGIGATYAYARHHRHDAAAQPNTVVVTRAASPATTAPKRTPKAVQKVELVPSVVGMPAAKAAALLTKAGLVPQQRPMPSMKLKGMVVSEQPAARTRLARGGKVLLLVSSGPPLVVVPSLVGQQEQKAVSALSTLGLKANFARVPGNQEAGTVVAQNPPSGTKAQKGTQVRLNVSKGAPVAPAKTRTTPTTTPKAAPPPKPLTPVLVHVPDVQGLKLAAARTAIRGAGLVTEIRYVPSQLAEATVTGQSPTAGTKVKRGSHVFLTVSQGSSSSQAPPQQTQQQSTTVPDVLGLDESTAVQTLENAGFLVNETDCPTSNQSQDGVVVDEQPAGATQAAPGSAVTICIGRYSPSG